MFIVHRCQQCCPALLYLKNAYTLFLFKVMAAVEAKRVTEMLNAQKLMALSNVSVKKALWAAGLSVLVRHA